MVYVERMRQTLTRRAGDWLARNSFPRIVVLAAYTIAALVAYQSSVSLEFVGLNNLTARMAIGFLLAWLTYAILIGIWLSLAPTIGSRELLENATDRAQTSAPSDETPDWVESFQRSAQDALRRDAKGVFGLVLGLAIFGVIFLLIYWLAFARWYLGELMVLAGKIQHRSIRGVARDAWIVAPMRQSFWMAFGLLLHFMLIGSLLSLKLA